ncbi:MAG TPA: hypothetical protein VGK10_16875 [Prolixibacteraceae bacterium]|jgi:hypothetical protein
MREAMGALLPVDGDSLYLLDCSLGASDKNSQNFLYSLNRVGGWFFHK